MNGPRRRVVNQVCLVKDVPEFLEAITAWDAGHYFPILIERPSLVLPFLRAFRPERVVRFRAGEASERPGETARLEPTQAPGESTWRAARTSVARATSGDGRGAERADHLAGAVPGDNGGRVPGVVLSEPASPMLAGAVALAAGHFQPLVRLEAQTEAAYGRADFPGPASYSDTLDVKGAWEYARRVEACVATVAPRYRELGDDCDFITLAGDWPYRYHVDAAEPFVGGAYALDDLIGRVFDGGHGGGWLQQTRRRWAYAGRLLGGPAQSVARAMGALFLQPSSALLWDTYEGGPPWSNYDMSAAADCLVASFGEARAVVHRAGLQADLARWHRTVAPLNVSGLVLINSAGGPRSFSIRGGPGRPGDLPVSVPAAVAMIHSFSAADPADLQTIAGRWLAQGAFVYFGSISEPFVHAFRPPRLVAELVTSGMPLVAALRRGEDELFGHPWRLIFLGDPLYRVAPSEHAHARAESMADAGPEHSKSAGTDAGRTDRLNVHAWQQLAATHARWPVDEIRMPQSATQVQAAKRRSLSDEEWLAWCNDSAIAQITEQAVELQAAHGVSSRRTSGDARPPDRSARLRALRRERLSARSRLVYDELLIDSLTRRGSVAELQARLEQIPENELGPLVLQAIERCACVRLARLADGTDSPLSFRGALDLWEEVIRLRWPPGQEFPADFTERVAALAQRDPARRLIEWHERLTRAASILGASDGGARHSRVAVVSDEQKRVAAMLGNVRP
jgi:hypothetical protein